MDGYKWVVFFACLAVSAPSYALRCGHELVKEGDYKDEVLEKCGEPDYFDSHYERVGNVVHGNVNQGINIGGRHQYPPSRFNYGQSHYQEVEILVEEWTYNFGRNRFNYRLRFENGRLKAVNSVGRRRR
jgi:hypothetical protein